MPILVVGADTVLGSAIAVAVEGRGGERRAFVSAPDSAAHLRQRGWKVATGDVSDGSHVAGAALGCHTVVLVPEAAFDERERSFAATPAATITAWVTHLRDHKIKRVIWLEDGRVAGADQGFVAVAEEIASVPTAGRDPIDIAADVARLDDAATLDEV